MLARYNGGMMHAPSYQYNQPPGRSTRSKVIIIVAVLAVVALLAGTVWWFFLRDNTQQEPPTQEVVQLPPAQEQARTEPEPDPLPNLQPVIDDFLANNSGTYGIFITDIDGNKLASTNPDQTFFTASIYKLYVAYEGYKLVDEGKYQLNDNYLNGKTRGECLDAMIRDSDSACGEKMWAELGKQYLDDRMSEYGLDGTSMINLNTTARDAAVILRKIQTGEGLSAQSHAAYLDSMESQDARYRRGLPSGFTKSTVYNKVGWNLDKEWHDTAIVVLPDGRPVIVSVFTNNAGYPAVAKLGSAIEQKLLE